MTRSVLFEAVVLGAVGATVGLALGVVLAIGIRALFATFGLDLSGQPLVFRPLTVVASYAVGIGVTTLAAYLPARRAARIAPVTALRDDVAMPESALHRRLVVGGLHDRRRGGADADRPVRRTSRGPATGSAAASSWPCSARPLRAR